MHQPTFHFFRHTVFGESAENVTFVATQHFAIQLGTVLLYVAVLVAGVEVRCQGHIQLQGSEFRWNHGEAVLSNDQGKATAVVPLHVELADIVDVVQGAGAARLQLGIGVFHLSEFNSGSCGELLSQEIQPFLWN